MPHFWNNTVISFQQSKVKCQGQEIPTDERNLEIAHRVRYPGADLTVGHWCSGRRGPAAQWPFGGPLRSYADSE